MFKHCRRNYSIHFVRKFCFSKLQLSRICTLRRLHHTIILHFQTSTVQNCLEFMTTTHHLMCIQRSFIPLIDLIVSTIFPKIHPNHTPHTTPLRQSSGSKPLPTNQTTLKPNSKIQKKKGKGNKNSHPTSSSSSPPSHTSHSAPSSSTESASFPVSASASLSLFSIPFAWVGVSGRGGRRRRFGRRRGGFLGRVWRGRSP